MENYNQNYAVESSDILTGFDVSVEQASGWKRFFNYILDLISFMIFIFAAGFLLTSVAPSTIVFFEVMEANPLLDRLFSLVLFALYIGAVEAIFKGKSFGKFVTGTRAVNEDGSRITGKTAFLRGLSRAVPFEPFSALGSPSYPWHDKWTDTYVIDERKSAIGF